MKRLPLVTGGALMGPMFKQLTSSPPRTHSFAPGARVGAFEIVEFIAAGGGGEVYRARRCDGPFEQSVALKVVAAHDDEGQPTRTECELLAQLTHPVIPRIFDGGELTECQLWFAMELVAGEPIDKYCARRQLGLRRRLALLRVVSEAAAHAHEQGIVHQDIKPSNVLVDEEGHPKLIDFGIATRTSLGIEARGRVRFTPGFASPEQLNNDPISPATDVYQLGLLIEDVMAAEGLEPPLGAMAQANLRAVVARATAALPAQRYPSAHELARELGRVAEDRPAATRSWPLATRLAFFSLRHRTAAVLVLSTIVITGILLMIGRARTEQAESAAEQAYSRAESIGSFLENLVRQADPSLNIGDKLNAVAVLDTAAEQVGRDATIPADIRYRLATTIIELYNELNEPEKSLDLGRKVLGAAATPDATTLRPWLLLQTMLADAEVTRGRFDAARQRLAEVRTQIASLPPDQAAEVRIVSAIVEGSAATYLSETELAEEILDRALRESEASFGERHRLTYLCHSALSRALLNSEPERALQHVGAAHRIALELYGEAHRFTLTTAIREANVASRLRAPAEALPLLNKAIETAQGIPGRTGRNHALLGFAESTRASIARRAAQFDLCVRAAGAALEHYAADPSTPPDARINPLTARARCFIAQGNPRQARADLESSLQFRSDVYAESQPAIVVDGALELAELLLSLDDVAAANAAVDRTLALARRSEVEPRTALAQQLVIAETRARGGRSAEAAEALSKVEVLLREHGDPDGTTADRMAALRTRFSL